MASNMWNSIEKNCEVCGQEIGSERGDYDPSFMTSDEKYLKGSTIEDENGVYLTICERCLSLIVRKGWKELEQLDEY